MQDLRLLAIITVIGYIFMFGVVSAISDNPDDDRRYKVEESDLYY